MGPLAAVGWAYMCGSRAVLATWLGRDRAAVEQTAGPSQPWSAPETERFGLAGGKGGVAGGKGVGLAEGLPPAANY